MAETLSLEEARKILGCIDCANLPSHRLDTRPCSVFNLITIIDTADKKGKCRKKPKEERKNIYKTQTVVE